MAVEQTASLVAVEDGQLVRRRMPLLTADHGLRMPPVLIEKGDLIRKYGFDGRLQRVEVTLSEWLWNAIEARQVLTLHQDYFRLRQPLERRIYEIARKFCGQQAQCRFRLVMLHHRCGAKGRLVDFRRALRRLIAKGDLLDYEVSHDAESDVVTFRRRDDPQADDDRNAEGRLPEGVGAEARRRHGAGIDLRAAEKGFHRWIRRKGIRPTSTAALFLKFLDSWADRPENAAAAGDAATDADDPPDWIAEMALEWWQTLDDAERESWRMLRRWPTATVRTMRTSSLISQSSL